MTVPILPYVLTPGAPERAQDLQANMNYLRDLCNGLLGDDNIRDDAIAQSKLQSDTAPVWKRIFDVQCFHNGLAAGTWFSRSGLAPVAAGAQAAPGLRRFDSDMVMAPPNCAVELRQRVLYVTNGVTPAINFVFSLRALLTVGGAAGQTMPTFSGTAVLPVTVNAPASNVAAGEAVSTAAALNTFSPASYAFACATSGAPTAGFVLWFRQLIEARHIPV